RDIKLFYINAANIIHQHTGCRSFTVFFFQAEDGIRDRNVTGVQTCALPISNRSSARCAINTANTSKAPWVQKPSNVVFEISTWKVNLKNFTKSSRPARASVKPVR